MNKHENGFGEGYYENKFRRCLYDGSIDGMFKYIMKKWARHLELNDAYVSAAIHQNAPITDIARRVGHSSTDVTLRIYAHAFGNELDSSKTVSNLVRQAYEDL